MRKCLVFLVIMSLLWSMTTNAFAAESDNVSYYKEEGQVNLENLLFSVDANNEVTAYGGSAFQRQRAENLINNSTALQDLIQQSIIEETEPVAIGYTRMYMKKVTDESNESYYMPVTEAEYNEITRASYVKGDESEWGNLTLYVIAQDLGGTISGTVTAEWSDMVYVTAEQMRASGRDHIGISGPSGTVNDYDGFSALCKGTSGSINLPSSRYLKTKTFENGVAYSFYEYGGLYDEYDVLYANIYATFAGKNNQTLTGAQKICGAYVHTWQDTSIDVAMGVSGIDFILSNTNNATEIGASVTIYV